MPIVTRIRRMEQADPESGLITLVIPKAVPHRWWHQLLHNQRGYMLKHALSARTLKELPGATRVIVEVPYHLPE